MSESNQTGTIILFFFKQFSFLYTVIMRASEINEKPILRKILKLEN